MTLNHENIKSDRTGRVFNPPVVGLNDNLDFIGRRLHVQTEHTIFPVARIITQVFCSGRVLLTKKSDCPAGIYEAHDDKELQRLMNAQHCQVIQEISDKKARALGSHQPPVNP